MNSIQANKIKNIALAGHHSSGKTALAEALLSLLPVLPTDTAKLLMVQLSATSTLKKLSAKLLFLLLWLVSPMMATG